MKNYSECPKSPATLKYLENKGFLRQMFQIKVVGNNSNNSRVSIKKFQNKFYMVLTMLFIIALTIPFKTLQLLFETFSSKSSRFRDTGLLQDFWDTLYMYLTEEICS